MPIDVQINRKKQRTSSPAVPQIDAPQTRSYDHLIDA